VVEAAPLPADLTIALESPQPRIRQGAVAGLADFLEGPDAGRALTARELLERVAADDIPLVAGAAQSVLDAHPESHGTPTKAEQPQPDSQPKGASRHPVAVLRATSAVAGRALARNRGRSALLAVALLALLVGGLVLTTGGNDSSGGTAEKTGPTISMLPIGASKAVVEAHLSLYDPPPTLQIELTPGGGKRFQLLLFDRLSDVRRFDKIPRSATLVSGDEEHQHEDLTTGNSVDTGYTRHYAPELPANYPRYRYFGIARVTGSTRVLVLYNEIKSLGKPA
jgi:hypothetical protein